MASRVIFAPRSYQREVRVARVRGIKRFVTVWHRRGGKDKTWLNFTLEELHKRVGVYFHIFPSLNQGRRDLWDNIGADGVPFMQTFPDELVSARNELEMQVTFKCGSIWQIMGADDPRAIARLRGPNPVGLIFSEWGNIHVSAWWTLSPVLAENGGWAAFAYTPPDVLPSCCTTGAVSEDGQQRCHGNHAKRYFEIAQNDPAWFCSFKTVEDTRRDGEGENGDPVISQEALNEERKDKSENHIQREYYCRFETPVEGSYYGALLARAEQENRVCNVAYDPNVPVHTSWDLGARRVSMAVGCFQLVGPEIHVLEGISNRDLGLPSYVHELKEKRPYNFGRHFLPHDANAHEIGTGKTRIETMRALGLRDITVVEKVDVADGIEQVKRLIPRMYFDRVKCADLLVALKGYHEENGRPKDDNHSHYADMLRYMAVGLRERRPKSSQMQRFALTQRDPFGRGPTSNRYATSRTREEDRNESWS